MKKASPATPAGHGGPRCPADDHGGPPCSGGDDGHPLHAGPTAFPPTGVAGSPIEADAVAHQTLLWIRQAVVGLNLCPFARAVLGKERLRIRVSPATTREALLEDLRLELALLLSQAETVLETTLLVCPQMLHDFLDFNDFLNDAEDLLRQMDLEGVVQLASFHPHYQFAGTRPDDIDNATNQSPWPTLHLLRETSIDRAVASMGGDTDRIFLNNIARLRAMGTEGWQHLRTAWHVVDDQATMHHLDRFPPETLHDPSARTGSTPPDTHHTSPSASPPRGTCPSSRARD